MQEDKISHVTMSLRGDSARPKFPKGQMAIIYDRKVYFKTRRWRELTQKFMQVIQIYSKGKIHRNVARGWLNNLAPEFKSLGKNQAYIDALIARYLDRVA